MGKIGQDLIQDRGIDRDMYCAECGYNLRTRPRIGRCPECGGQYDARPLGTRGILLPGNLHFPFDFWFAFVVGALISVIALIYALCEQKWWPYTIATLFILMSWFLLRAAFLNSVKYFRYRAILRESSRQNDDDES